MESTQLTGLNIFPIKSTAPIRLAQAVVGAQGLQWDRRWMLVDASGLFMTGRKFPRLTLIQSRVIPEGIEVSAPDMPSLVVPVDFPFEKNLSVRVWSDQCLVPAYGKFIDQWFSSFLNTDCHLVFMPTGFVRRVDPAYASPQDQVSFADGFPLLLISEGSLADVNQRLPIPVPMDRFRPNLVVRGCEAFAEDSWQRIRIGEVLLKVAKPCSRCVFTTVDPQIGARDVSGEPLQTLSSYRKRADGKVYFGQNVLIENVGVLRIGDLVELL